MKNIFLIDLDDTVLDFGRSEREQLIASLQAHGIPADAGTAARFHVINDGLWKKLERGEITRERLAVERFELLLAELNAPASAPAVAQHYFQGMGVRAYAIEGAAHFLQTLAARGRVYAVTNGARALQRPRIAAAGLARYFTDVFVSEEVGFAKPSQGYVDYVLAHIPAFSCGSSVYVGDSLTSDMVCAERMGVDFILYRPSRPQGYKGMLASDYPALLALLEGM